MVVLGCAEVGKTTLISSLCGEPFNRKSGYKTSMEEECNHQVVEMTTSAGLILVHFYDWAWKEKMRAEVDITPTLAKGKDGAMFVMVRHCNI